MQNVLLRYALKHNLNIVLPEKDVSKQGSSNVGYIVNDWSEEQAQPRFGRHLIQNTPWEKANLTYHMFVLHTRWNHHEITKVMNRQGNEKLFYFSILRDPVTLFRSYWDYFGLSQKYGKTLDEYAQSVISQYILNRNMNWHPGYNQMLHDFGMNFPDMFKGELERKYKIGYKKEVTEVLEEIDRSFDLVLLADEEYFEDGMVLLRHDLCWEFEDIINLKRNARSKAHRSNLSEHSRKIIKGNIHHAMITPYINCKRIR